MRQAFGAGVLLWVAVFLPAFLFAPRQEENTRIPMETEQKVSSAVELPSNGDGEHTLLLWEEGTVREMAVEEYLRGVLRAEMGGAFHMEALKAQTVAERTYLYYQMEAGAKAAHPSADVCVDPGCCTAYLSEEGAREKWGAVFEEYEENIHRAVSETDNQVMYYGGEPIMAVFHSSSAGVTATSGEVWTADLPYLVSVESPESADTVPNYYSVNTFSAEEFRKLFTARYPEAKLTGAAASWISDVIRSDTGRVESAVVGGVAVTGQEMRSVFSLRSTAFTVETDAETVTFRVTGYGHGVGMSQYGANTLAQEGKTWQEILRWYYTGITIDDYTDA
ncbi:MAG: stage II sporulation protein D [Oscillospiraceae bacterium]|nr:stage II sporulation protein D [Oscillospiraceae bacterium]